MQINSKICHYCIIILRQFNQNSHKRCVCVWLLRSCCHGNQNMTNTRSAVYFVRGLVYVYQVWNWCIQVWQSYGHVFKKIIKNGYICSVMPRSHIHRAPHDCSCPVLPGGLPWILETVGLPCEFNFCGVCGHIFYDVRAVPFKNWKSLIVRRP